MLLKLYSNSTLLKYPIKINDPTVPEFIPVSVIFYDTILRDDWEIVAYDLTGTQPVVFNIDGKPNLELKVTSMLRTIGIPTNVKGYQYIREAIMMCVDDPTVSGTIVTALYPSIADKHNDSPSSVERAIRHAIETTWNNRGNIEVLNSIFGNTINGNKGKPTNSEFITLIADDIRIDCMSYLHIQH